MKKFKLITIGITLTLTSGCGIFHDIKNESHTKLAKDSYFEHIRSEKVISDPIVKWRNIGPGMSGYNEKLWIHPINSKVMFMAPDMHVTYGTWDGGESWHSIKDHDELGQLMKRVVDIEFSLQDPNYAVALDWNGWVYQTFDQGRHWEKLAELSPSYKSFGVDPYDPKAFKKGWYDEQIGMRLSELTIDPTNDHIWYVGAGDFWNVKENHRSLAKPHGNKLTYADYGYIYKTMDKGKTWQKISAGLPEDLDVGKIIVNPLEPNHVIMASNHGLLQSFNGGITWNNNHKGLPNNLPRDLTHHYNEKTGEFTLYLVEQTTYQPQQRTVGSKGGVYKSTDAGKTWKNITGNLALDLTKINYPAEIARYYRTIAHWFGIPNHVAKAKYSDLPQVILPVFNRIVVNPKNSNELYLTYNKKHDRTFAPGEVWRTLDGGKTWHVVARHGKYWLANNDNAYWTSRGNDTGANVEFSHVQAYMNEHVEQEGNRLLTINGEGDIFISVAQQTQKSANQGKSWQQIDDIEISPNSGVWIGRGNSDLPGRFMLHETGIEHRRLFTSGEHGLWETVPLDNWSDKQAVALKQIEGQNNISGMVSVSTVAVHPHNPDIIYITAWRQYHKGKLRRSLDGGKTWENIATLLDNKVDKENSENGQTIVSKNSGQVIQGPPGLLPAHNSLIIDPQQPKNMYLAVTEDAFSEIYRAPRRQPTIGGYGVLKSTDGGYTWQTSNDGFHQGFNLRRIIFDPNNSNILYAATNDENGGLYKSINQGVTWQRMSIPSIIKRVNNVFIDRNTQQLFISTGGFYQGKYEEGGAWRSNDLGETWQKIFKAPLVLQVESSPVDSNILLLNTGQQMNMNRQFMNPGVYLSLDGGGSWKKINHQLTNYDKIIDIKPDPYNKNVIWAAGWGSGWFVGYINGANGEGWFQP